jgi:Fur family transcriptional regulator, peroxide stress response regulator
MESLPLDHESLRSLLEHARLRCTPQRLAVYDYRSLADHHPTAEEVFQSVRAAIPRISLATVYKALEALVSLGAAAKLAPEAGDTRARYDARRDLHYHFRCLRTGMVHDLPTPFDPDLISKLDPAIAAYLNCNGFQFTGYRLELLGFQDEPAALESPANVPDSAAGDAALRSSPRGHGS